jgi:hypothetical protein
MVLVFKYFASLRIDNLSVNINQNLQSITTLSLVQVEIKFAKCSNNNKEIIESIVSNLSLNYNSSLVVLDMKSTKANLMLKKGHKLLDIIENIELNISNASLSNKLDMKELIEMASLHKNNSLGSTSINENILLLKKVCKIDVNSFIYNFNDLENDDFMKLDRLRHERIN